MPVTRGRARMIENEEEDVEIETSQMMQETQDEPEQQSPTAVEAPKVVNLKEMAKQASRTHTIIVLTNGQIFDFQLENDAAMIQAGMDELHRMQENRAERIVGRLKNASSTILTFGDANEDAHKENPGHEGDDYEDEMMN
ncbi:unnamed protein product [Peronospora belbahrii]|uniref:Uncharacterized protein n=1 Tax=Peronospora belbahrii TaxID=622444 RepID=A0ABN8DAD6_9STRA|nr:unnamed protein product [Peronospora belbahrii]